MALSLPKGLGSKRQAYLLAVLAVLLILFVVRWRPGGKEPPSSSSSSSSSAAVRGPRAGNASPDAGDAPVPVARERGSAKITSPDEVPLLKPEDFGPAPVKGSTDTGRDLFGFAKDPTRVPPPTPTPHGPLAGEAGFVGPMPPPAPTPTPKPPEVTFKFLGTFGPKEHPIAVLREGDSIYNARAGDILFGKFVLRKVGYESIDVGFVGFADSETKRLGITP